MSYCLNPSCPKPVNHPKARKCKACGSKLLLRDRYHLVKGLGKGGFGATFLAADISLPGNPLCVIKQLRPNTDNPNFLSMARELFEREARTLGKVGNHPQIPRLLDYFEDREQFYLVQEFVKGNNLQQEIKKNGVLNEAQVKQVVQEVLLILKDIHSKKVIHRDIKPANIIRREIDNKLVLIDFGVVKNQVNTIAAGNGDQTALTAFAVGTPGFAPPEQLAMRPVYASDVYALGVTCMYLMSGKAPKNMDSDPLTGEIDWFKYIDVSDKFADILLAMVEVSVKNRYKTADEVLDAMDIANHIEDLADNMLSGTNQDIGNTSIGLRGDLRTSARRTVPPTSTSRSSRSRIQPNSASSRRTSSSRNAGSRTQVGRNQSRNSASSRSSRTPLRGYSRNNSQDSRGSREPSKPVKVDKDTLLSYYAKGRRDFSHKDISLQNLEKANLSGTKFNSSRMIKINLQNADLSSTKFNNCDLRQASLRNANLSRAYLSSANLEGADLRGANLTHANFDATKLKGANLCGANLTSAIITEEQLQEAKTNWTTVLPSGRRGFW